MNDWQKQLLRDFINEHWSEFVDHIDNLQSGGEQEAENILAILDEE